MFLRNGKRKLDINEEPPKKRLKISPSKRKPLYINDRNTYNIEIEELRNVGPETSWNILSEIRNAPFKSEQDLVKRVKGITQKSIDASPVNLIFRTRFEEQTESIYKTLLNIKWIKEACDETNILRIIAEHSIGNIATCDNTDCDESILLADHDKLYHYDDGFLFLSDEESYIFCEDKERKFYYYRKSEQLGNALYCHKCCEELRHCSVCARKIFFKNKEETYNTCSGAHVQTFEQDGNEVRRAFGYRICNDCTACDIHQFAPNLLFAHEREDNVGEVQ